MTKIKGCDKGNSEGSLKTGKGGHLVEFIFYALGYLFTGYFIGKVACYVYYDNTPSKDLNLSKKFLRRLFFPYTYTEWSNREGWVSEEFILGHMKAHKLCCIEIEKEKEAYCQVMAFLWPCRIFPALAGLVICAFLFLGGVVSLVFLLPRKTLSLSRTGAKKIGRGAKRLGLLSPSLTAELDEIDGVLTDIAAQKKKIEDRTFCTEGEIQNLAQNLDEWRGLGGKTGIASETREKVLEELSGHLADKEGRLEEMKEIGRRLEEKGYELDSACGVLRQCEKTQRLGVRVAVQGGNGAVASDGLATLASECLRDTKTKIDEAKGLLAQAEGFTEGERNV